MGVTETTRTRARAGRARGGRAVRGVAGVLVFLAVGEVVGRAGLVDRAYLPPTSDVARALVRLLGDGEFLSDLGATLVACMSGLLIALLAGAPAGLLLGSLPGVNAAVRVVVEFLRPIPGVALIPLAIMLIAEQAAMERALAAYAAIWPIMLNTIYAVGEVDPLARDTARGFGFGRAAIALRVTLPSVAPFVATGVRVAAGITLIVVVSTELIAGGGEHGVGVFILAAGADAGHADVVYAAVAAVGLLGYLIDVLLRWAGRRLFPWHFARG